MKKEKIDVVHAHTYTPLFYAVPAALLAGGVKVVYTEHGRLYPDHRRWKRYLTNPLLSKGVDHIISISEKTREAMIAYDNFPARRIGVIHNGIDCRLYSPNPGREGMRRSLGLENSCRVVGTAARLEDIKNLPMMLRAFRMVLDQVPDAVLLIAGTGSKEGELKVLADTLGIGQRVIFLGLRSDMPDIFRAFDLFVLSSFTEGIAVTLLEAMATGIPAVVTEVGGNPEVVREGETGFLVPLGDDAMMAKRIIEVLNNTELAKMMGEKGRERILREFSFEGMISAYHELYETSARS